jgi:acetyl esterase/lipase
MNCLLAPENPYPAQLEDAVAAYRWLLDQGFEPGHIATVGQSAGGNLCTAVVLKLREEGLPLPAAIMPTSAWYDMELKSDSIARNEPTDSVAKRPVLEQMRSNFLGDHTPPDDPFANPLYADLSGLPPILIHVATEEALFDDTTRFVEAARAAGVDVEMHGVEGVQHSFVLLAGQDRQADEAIARMGAWVRPKLGL